MKVKVTHTVGIEDVPKLINDIIINCQQKMLNESKNLKYYVNDLDKLHVEVSHVRESISLVDSQLEDVLNMAIGLEGVINSAEQGMSEEELPSEIES